MDIVFIVDVIAKFVRMDIAFIAGVKEIIIEI